MLRPGTLHDSTGACHLLALLSGPGSPGPSLRRLSPRRPGDSFAWDPGWSFGVLLFGEVPVRHLLALVASAAFGATLGWEVAGGETGHLCAPLPLLAAFGTAGVAGNEHTFREWVRHQYRFPPRLAPRLPPRPPNMPGSPMPIAAPAPTGPLPFFPRFPRFATRFLSWEGPARGVGPPPAGRGLLALPSVPLPTRHADHPLPINVYAPSWSR